MKLFNKVGIVGIGLIGGSLALAIKKRGLANEVIAVSRHRETLLLAKEIGAIDKGSLSLELLSDADLLIFAAPINTILELAPKISEIIRDNCIVTDVGSIKEEIVLRLEKIFSKYIGSHPLAGSEKSGIKHADPAFFPNSLCILTPTKRTDHLSLSKVRKFWKAIGARTVLMPPEIHDKILSFTSHLPHIASFSLLNAVPKQYLKFSASGLKDTTRIAASNPNLWAEIFLANQKNILGAIDTLQDHLSKIRAAILNNDKKQLALILKKAKDKRDSL